MAAAQKKNVSLSLVGEHTAFMVTPLFLFHVDKIALCAQRVEKDQKSDILLKQEAS